MEKITLTENRIFQGSLILVNSKYSFRSEPEERLIPVRESVPHILLQRCAVVLLEQLMYKIGGWSSIVPVSGWRARSEQQIGRAHV